MIRSIADNTYPLFLNILAQSTLRLVIAVVVLGMMKNASAARRHSVAAITILALMVLPMLAWKLPEHWRIPLLQHRAQTQVLPMGNIALRQSGTAAASSSQTPANAPVESHTPHYYSNGQDGDWATSLNPDSGYSVAPPVAVITLWAAVCLCLIIRQSIALIRLGLLSRRSSRTGSAAIREILEAFPAAVLVPRRINLIVDPEGLLAAPVTWGLVRPVLLIPQDIESWSESGVAPVLIHEIEHIRRSDWLIQSAAYIACAFYWIHPLAWYLYRTMRLDAEVACDDAVIRAGIPAAHYAEELLAIVEAVKSRRRLSGAIGIFRPNQVTHRTITLYSTPFSHSLRRQHYRLHRRYRRPAEQ